MWGKYERGLASPGGDVLAALAKAGWDVRYILTGERPELQRRLEAISVATAIAGRVSDQKARYQVQEDVFNALVHALNDDELQVLRHYQEATDAGKAAIKATAAAQAGLALGERAVAQGPKRKSKKAAK